MPFLLGAILTARAAAAATNAADGRERDLGMGLAYHRIHQLPADLPAQEGSRPPACVVDLRYVRTDGPGAKAFQGWLAARTSIRSPVFVLANGETDRDLLTVLREQAQSPGLVVIGMAARNFRPDVAVLANAADERRAYDAFENGATIASLLTDNPGKLRYDETSLGKDRPADQPARAAGDGNTKGAVPPRTVDAALQRAVHLHRSLLALKKI